MGLWHPGRRGGGDWAGMTTTGGARGQRELVVEEVRKGTETPVQVGSEERGGRVREAGELAGPSGHLPEARTACSLLAPIYPALGTSEPVAPGNPSSASKWFSGEGQV